MKQKPKIRFRRAPRKAQPTEAQQQMPNYQKTESGVWRNIIQIPLDYYLQMPRGGINEVQYEAGNKLHELFTKAGIYSLAMPGFWYCGENYLGGSGDTSDLRLDYYDQAVRAIRAANGHIGRFVLERVCCYGEFLKNIEVPGYQRPDQKMARLKEALDDLVEHFALPIPPNLELYYSRRWD